LKRSILYSVFYLFLFKVSFSQFSLVDKNTGKEILIVASSYPVPTKLKALGKVKTSGHTGIDDNVQIELLAKKAAKKGANFVRVTDFIFSPGSQYREGLIEGEMYYAQNFDSLKAALIQRNITKTPGYSEVIIYRPMFGLKQVDEHTMKLKLDTLNLEIGANKAFKLILKNDSTYFIKIPDYALLKLIVKPGVTNFVRCSYKVNSEGTMASSARGLAGAVVFIQLGGQKAYYLPDVLVGGSAKMKELEYLMSGFTNQ